MPMTNNPPSDDDLLETPSVHAQPDVDATGARLLDLEQQARAAIEQRPIAAVLLALGFGYIVARLASRTSR
jgi:hypothetical protein